MASITPLRRLAPVLNAALRQSSKAATPAVAFRRPALAAGAALGSRRPFALRPTTALCEEPTSRLPPPSSSAAEAAIGERGLKAKWVPASDAESTQQPKLDVVPRLQMTFTCTAPLPVVVEETVVAGSSSSLAAPEVEPVEPAFAPCSHRSTHTFTRQAYTKGTVLIQCPACSNRHLIADHLGWFKELTEEGKGVDVEGILRARGEKVRRGSVGKGGDGTVEFYPTD